ncbi:MAG: antitoxin [Actinomycetota bacterium]|jgi:uncharacterized protein YjbJ (UPF0337 family)
MGKMDEMKQKAREALTQNRDKIEERLDRAAGKAKEKAGDEHSGKIDSVLERGKDALDKFTGDRPEGSPPGR